jgi:hypothetical protein
MVRMIAERDGEEGMKRRRGDEAGEASLGRCSREVTQFEFDNKRDGKQTVIRASKLSSG